MENELGEACGPCGGKRLHTRFCWENMKKEWYLEDTEIYGWIRLKCIYLSTHISSETRWNRLLLRWSNFFIKLVVKKNTTQFTFKTYFRKPYCLWITEHKVLCVYYRNSVIKLTNLQRYSEMDLIASKNNKSLIVFRLCMSRMFIIQKYLIAHWHYMFNDFEV
jgi:hypothetical protein